jgi:hypothetical protein
VKLSLFLIIAVLYFLSDAFGQTLKGEIVDGTGNPVPSVIIRNISRQENTISDLSGTFHIPAFAGDSIQFSRLGYFPVFLEMSDSGATSRRIFMRQTTISLKEVEIRPDWTPYQLDSIARRQTYHTALDRRKERSIMSPVSAIAENISRKSRQRWRFQQHFEQWETQKFIDTRYSFEEVSTLTGLKGDSLAAFIHAYPMLPDYARSASDLEIKMWIRFNYRQWMKHPDVPRITQQNIEDTLH